MNRAPLRSLFTRLIASLFLIVTLMCNSRSFAAGETVPSGQGGFQSDTKVLKWPGGKQAVFLLEFDDSAPTAIKNVIPELTKRGMVGTFYINPGNPPYKSLKKEWEKPAPGIEYANHTFTHVGATSAEQLDGELAKCNAEITERYPGRKTPRLISFGQPGGVPWTITQDEKKVLLEKYHLVERPPFKGYPFHFKTGEEILALVDAALRKQDMDYIVFHGVGGDWLSTPMELFTALLDKLDATRDQLWITDPVSWHQYVTERKSTEVKQVPADKGRISLQLTSTLDPAFYDLPLTLETSVPPDWKTCRIRQGKTDITVPVKEGKVQYSALPGTEPVSIEPVSRG